MSTEKMYKLYLIKCETTGFCYVGYTDSTNPKYNPISYLYNQYKTNENRYKLLGESIKANKFSSHQFQFMKENLTKVEASELSEKIKSKLASKLLNDPVRKSIFDEELALLENL
jgi:hypothetical protein